MTLRCALALLLSLAPGAGASDFLAGVNYPWSHYGWDFGENAWGHQGVSAPAARAVVDKDFAFLKSKGVKVARWFVLCDGRASPEFGPDGSVTGFDEHFFADMDAALAIAERNGIRLILVLFDFHLLDPASFDKGVQMGGRAALLQDPKIRDSLFDKALLPLLSRYGKHPAILAWEAMNEPEMRLKDEASISSSGLDAFVRRFTALVHAETSHLATLGSWKRSRMARWKGAGLDLYQFHHYADEPGESHAAPCVLDKPCLLGEFPTKNGPHGLEAYLDAAFNNDYAGALPWSYRSTDRSSDFAGVADRFSAWVKAH